jgi:uncharacterized protein
MLWRGEIPCHSTKLAGITEALVTAEPRPKTKRSFRPCPACTVTSVRYSRGVMLLDDTLTPVSWRSKPRSFVALMGLYESNFIRLQWLTGALTSLEGQHRSAVAGDCDLLLNVTERSPYTSTLNLTYLLEGEGPESTNAVRYPDMRVRVYHDAHVVEALEWATTHGQPEHSVGNPEKRQGRDAGQPVLKALRSHAERELDQRWARNVMLNKWLEYCVERGHRFSPATRLPAAAES